MAKLSVKVMGAKEIQDLFKKMDIVSKSYAKEVIQESSLNVMSGAKKRCPVAKEKGVGGTLRASIRPSYYNNGLTADVGTNLQYGPFVEFGTGRSGAASDHPPLPEGYTHGAKPGMPAQPYLYPAFEAERPSFESKMKDIVEHLI